MEEELTSWIQDHTSSKVTPNFLKTIRNIAKVHRQDSTKFVKACMALGNFKGQEHFLEQLLGKLKDQQPGTAPKRTSLVENHDSDFVVSNGKTAAAKKPVLIPKPKPFKRLQKKKLLSLSYEDEEEKDELFPKSSSFNSVSSIKSQTSISFKKINKDAAKKLKEFSINSDDKQSSERLEADRLPLSVPKLEVYSDEDQISAGFVKKEQSSEPEMPSIHESDEENIMDKEDIIAEERDWYASDDDYGNVTADDFVDNSFSASKKSNQKHIKGNPESNLMAQIQLNSIPLSQRSNIIPPFLTSYNNKSGERAIIGSMDISQEAKTGLISPIRNADSEFCINAKKGSHLVAMKRLQRDHKSKSKETANLVGTGIGSVLGMKETPEIQNDPQKQGESIDETQSFEDIQKVRESLPASKVKSQILEIVRENQVTIVIGETGSGKTTQLAQFLYENGHCKDGKLIGCTQPRRVAAMSVAKRVALEMGVELGNEVGYSIRFEDETSKLTRIKFMTDGILLRETLMDEMLDKYSCIIMDEAHERSLNTDVLLGFFKELLRKRRDLKLIVTSATMNANKFSQFFGNAPQFTIPGRTFPVQVVYTRYPVSDYVESAVTQALKTHLSTPVSSGDILIFMTGQEDIEVTCEVLKEKLLEVYSKKLGIASFEDINDIEILPIYSSLPADVQGRIFKATDPNKRKVVVATNIAETSLTVDGIKYVIDCGYSKLKVYNPRIGLDSLTVTPISLANADQRSGRAGRTGPGIAYRLYTEDSAYEDMYPQAIPEIQRTNLSNTLLLLKSLGVEDLLKFPFIDPPPTQILMTSLFELWSIGALDNMGNLTKLGIQMAKFPLRPSLSKILLVAASNGCSKEMISIVSMLSVPQVFYRPKERQEESDQARNRFFVSESDHLTLLNVYSQWKANNYSYHWCNKHFLQYKSLQRAREIKHQLLRVMEKLNIPVVSSGADWDVVRKSICSGYAHQAAKISGLGKYVHLKNGMGLQLHPTSALFGLGDLPPYVVYHELLLTSKEYINVVTTVDPFWLMEFGGLFYNIRRRREEEEYGLYETEKEQDTSKDSLDFKIEKCTRLKEVALKRLQDDKIEYEKFTNAALSKRKGKETSKSGVSIGFKRRKPL